MKKYLKTILTPLRIIPFTKMSYTLGMLLEGLMFPCIQLLLSLMQKYLVNSVEYNDAGYMTYVYILAAAILIMLLIINPIANYFKEKSMRIFTMNIREYSIDRLIRYPHAYYEKNHSGDIISRLRGDVESLAGIYSGTLFRLILGIFYGVGSIILMTFLCWQLAILVIFLGVFETYVIAEISKKIEKNTEIAQKAFSKQNQLFFDIVKALSFIKMASLGKFMNKKYNNVIDETIDVNIKINKINILLNSVNIIFEALNLLIVLSVGIVLYFAKIVDLGSVMSFLILQDGISYMIDNLKGFFGSINGQIVNFKRASELWNQEPEIAVLTNDNESITNDTVFLDHVTFRYETGDSDALNDVSCTIPKGQITVIYGPSGGGKSTLVKLLLKLYPINSGSIKIGDIKYEELDTMTIRDFYTYVSQETYLFYDSVEMNIRCGNENATMDEVIEAAKFAGAHDFIINKSNGYQTMIEEHGHNFSGGEKQRIAIARAVLKNSNFVILDEATSAIDLSNEANIFGYIIKQAKSGKTILIIAHRESTLKLADNAIKIKHGKMIE